MADLGFDTSNLAVLMRGSNAVMGCCNVCTNCGQYTITFSGVQDCLNEDENPCWPSDLNTTFVAPYTRTVGGNYYFEVTAGGWDILLYCIPSTCAVHIDATVAGDEAFATVTPKLGAGPYPNVYDVLSCSDNCSPVMGYDGSVAIVWDSTGC
jgi:hypothetical protein